MHYICDALLYPFIGTVRLCLGPLINANIGWSFRPGSERTVYGSRPLYAGPVYIIIIIIIVNVRLALFARRGVVRATTSKVSVRIIRHDYLSMISLLIFTPRIVAALLLVSRPLFSRSSPLSPLVTPLALHTPSHRFLFLIAF